MDRKGRPSPNIQDAKLIVLHSDIQSWVEFSNKCDGLILVDPDPKLFITQMCLLATGVTNVTGENPFHVLFANFSWTQIELRPRQAISKSAAHSAHLVESHITDSKMFSLITDEIPKGKLRKRHIHPKNINTINRHLVHQRKSHNAEDIKPKSMSLKTNRTLPATFSGSMNGLPNLAR